MARRIQFSLRVLFGVVALASVLLGTWSLFDSYGTNVDAEDARIGAPIRITARYFRAFGPPDCGLVVGYARTDETGSMSKHLRVRRSWLCFYRVEYEFDPIERPCQITVFLNLYERSNSLVLKEKIVDLN
jgi:hypothetical protein